MNLESRVRAQIAPASTNGADDGVRILHSLALSLFIKVEVK